MTKGLPPFELITKGYMHQGPHANEELIGSLRGWVVYPDPGEDRIPVMIVKAKE